MLAVGRFGGECHRASHGLRRQTHPTYDRSAALFEEYVFAFCAGFQLQLAPLQGAIHEAFVDFAAFVEAEALVAEAEHLLVDGLALGGAEAP